MGDATPVLSLALAIGGTIIGGPWGAALVIGAGLLNAQYQKDLLDDQEVELQSRSHQINTRTSNKPLPLPYGVCKLGVNKTFLQAQNPFLHIIAEIGEGPVSGIVREDGSIYNAVNTSLPRTNPPQIFLDDRIWTDIPSENIDIQFFRGEQDQPLCTSLASAIPDWSQTLPFTTYLYIRLKYDREIFSKGDPEITAILEGLEIYNPVTDTTEFTDNAAIVALDYMTRSSENGGIGLPLNLFDSTSLQEAISYCSLKGWTYNAPINSNQNVADNLQLIFNCFRGDIYQNNEGLFKVIFKDLNFEPVAMNISDKTNIIENTLNVRQPSIIGRPNAIRALFVDPENGYKVSTYQQNLDFSLLTTEESDIREQEVKLYGLSDQEKLQGMATYFLERLRLNKTFTVACGKDAIRLEVNDIITITHSVPGWVDKLARVQKTTFNPQTGIIELECIEEAEFFYNDTFDLTNHIIRDTVLPNPNADVFPVRNLSTQEQVYFYRDRSFTRLFINFDPPLETLYPFYSYSEIWISVGNSDNYRFVTTSIQDYIIDPVNEGEIYFVKIVAVAIFGGKQKKQSFAAAPTVSVRIVGKTDRPSDIQALTALVSGQTVTLVAQPIPDTDLLGYEIRRGLSWENGLFHALSNGPQFPITPIRPGNHVFWMAAKDNSGNYSENPISTVARVLLPPGYSQLQQWSYDYTEVDGIFDNTTLTVFNLENSLKRKNNEIQENISLVVSNGNITQDSNGVYGCSVIYNGSEYRMYYNGLDGSNNGQIVRCTNSDITVPGGWANHSVLSVNTIPDNHGDNFIKIGEVVYNTNFGTNKNYQYWITTTSNTNVERIYYSSDSIGSVLDNIALCIDIGSQGTYDTHGVSDPSVVVLPDNSFYMVYTGQDVSGTKRLISCTSTDGVNFTGFKLIIDIGILGDADSFSVKEPAIYYDPSRENVVLYYTGVDSIGVQSILLAVSINNGNTFQNHQVALLRDTQGTDDIDSVGYPELIELNDTYQFFYTGIADTTLPGNVTLEWNGANAELNGNPFELTTLSIAISVPKILYSVGSSNPIELSGNWASPIRDLGQIYSFQLNLDFDSFFMNSNGTWDAIVPIPTTWDQLNALDTIWSEIIGGGIRGQITIVLRYREQSTDTWNVINNFELYSAEITARYVQIIITITDPTSDSFTIIGPVTLTAYSGPQN